MESGGTEEMGRIMLSYKLQVETLEEIIFEDNHALEKAYFDPFVKDKSVIKENLLKIEKMIKLKGDELEKKYQALDARN